MLKLVNLAGTITGIIGVLVCIVAGVSRLSGQFYLGTAEATTIFSLGTSLMVMGCLLKLHGIALTLK